jgi:hypothetical protein
LRLCFAWVILTTLSGSRLVPETAGPPPPKKTKYRAAALWFKPTGMQLPRKIDRFPWRDPVWVLRRSCFTTLHWVSRRRHQGLRLLGYPVFFHLPPLRMTGFSSNFSHAEAKPGPSTKQSPTRIVIVIIKDGSNTPQLRLHVSKTVRLLWRERTTLQ